MSSKRLHYSDEKWLDLISECRSSGLSDKDWCMEHQIGISTFITMSNDFAIKHAVFHQLRSVP